MASMIWLHIKGDNQVPLCSCRTANISSNGNTMYSGWYRPVIAKGNRIEGIEAQY